MSIGRKIVTTSFYIKFLVSTLIESDNANFTTDKSGKDGGGKDGKLHFTS